MWGGEAENGWRKVVGGWGKKWWTLHYLENSVAMTEYSLREALSVYPEELNITG